MTAAKKLIDDKLLKTLVPFGDLTEEQFSTLRGQYNVESFDAGKTLFKQGDNDDRTYFLISGQVNLHYGDGETKNVVADTAQAQYALVPVRPRQATATAKTPISVLSLDASLFQKILSWGHEEAGVHVTDLDTHEDENDWMTCFLQSKVFLRLPAQNIQALMMRLEEVKVKAGQIVIRQGDDDGYYYIIKSGRCRVTRKHSPKAKELELAVLSVGEGFGEEAIITHNRRGASITMLEDGCLMRLSRNDFNRLLVEPLLTIVNYNEVSHDPKTVFLDVRNFEDYSRDGITGSENITLTELRLKIDQFNSNKQYVVCSNTGSRAAAAAFLLCQQGIDAVVLRYGLENLPANVERGNGDISDVDEIPVVDNIVSLKKETLQDKTSLAKPELKVSPKISPAAPVNTDEAMKDPRVKALFTKAQRRVHEENSRAKQAEIARQKAEKEVNRLKEEAEQARKQLEEAKRQADKASHESAEAARLQAKREAARLSELELGTKQAELEEAVRQAEEEAQRKKDANLALHKAEQEIENLKNEMHLAVQKAQQEAHKSAEAMKQFLEQEAHRQKQEAARIAEKEAQRAREAEQAHQKAQEEILRLKADAEATRERLKEQARIEAEQARLQAEQAKKQAEQEVERLRLEVEQARKESEALAAKKQQQALAEQQAEAEAAIRQARMEAQSEIEKLRQQAAKAKDAENAREQAEKEIARIKLEAEQERLRIEEQAVRIAEAARAEAVEEAWKISEAKQTEIDAVAQKAEQEAKRAIEAEEARRRAEQEIERLKSETETAQLQMQAQLSSEISRSEIEHEVAKARALELANKQAEIEEVTRRAEAESSRALHAESVKKSAELEIENLKREMEQLREQQKLVTQRYSEGMLSSAEQEDLSARKQALVEKQTEIEQVSIKAAEQTAKATAAEQARQQAEAEILRLRSEVEEATLQAQAQLQADAERAATEQRAMKERAAELEKMQRLIAEAEYKAYQEAERAKQAEVARRQSEEQLARLKAAEEANVKAQQEIQRLKAEAGMAYYQAQEQAKLTAEEIRQKAELEIQKARAEEAGRKQLEVEQASHEAQLAAERAAKEEKARKLAEAEIRKLRAEAKLQRIKAEKALREAITSIPKETRVSSDKSRAAKVTMTTTTATTKAQPSVKKYVQNSDVLPTDQDDDPLGILDLSQPKNTGATDQYDFSKEMADADGGGFISDQDLWETALGVREDKVAESTIESRMKQPSESSTAHAATEQPVVRSKNTQSTTKQQNVVEEFLAMEQYDEQPQSRPEPAYASARDDQPVFRAKEVNPHVSTQDVTDIARKRKHVRSGGIFKYVMVIFSLCVCAAAAYYFTLSDGQREDRREQIKTMIDKNIPHAKNTENSPNKSASGKANELSDKATAKSAAPVIEEKPQRPLTMEERLELKREKAIEDITRRHKAQERKIEKSKEVTLAPEKTVDSEVSNTAGQYLANDGALPTLGESQGAVTEGNATQEEAVEITIVNPVSNSGDTGASEINAIDNSSNQSENNALPQLLPLNEAGE